MRSFQRVNPNQNENETENRSKMQQISTCIPCEPHAVPKFGNIQISKELLEHIIPDTIKETISNVYAYLDRSIAMQYNDGEIIDGEIIRSLHYEIINCDFHETKTDEPLFCVVEKCTPNDTKKKYSRKMKDHLFTGDELSQFKLPKSSRTKLPKTERNRIHNMYTKDMVNACKWNEVPVFTQPEHKQRVTLSISIELL
eukprot:644294_1